MGRVDFYGLVNVESELEPKNRILNTDRPALDSSGYSYLLVGLRLDRVGRVGWADGLMDSSSLDYPICMSMLACFYALCLC